MIDLYSWKTSNGKKASIMLEECGLDYNIHPIHIGQDDQFTPEYTAINPNGKIPAIIDQDGPGSQPYTVIESGAILMYLAEKTGKFMPQDMAARYEVIQWLMFQMGGIGPMFGQFGFFHKFAGKEIEDKRGFERYRDESRRLIGVLDGRLDGREYIMDDYSIADIAIWPWLRGMIGFYEAGDIMEMEKYPNASEWLERCAGREASKKAVNIPARD